MNNTLNILVKFPTRGRPVKFLTALSEYVRLTATKDSAQYIVSCDADDETMNNKAVQDKIRSVCPTATVRFGNSKTKIQAVNADVSTELLRQLNVDIIVLASDDMIPVEAGWDETIRKDMLNLYPDTDGVLWYHDGYRKDFNTLSILGRKYYERFGYIYHPSYKSFWCDNEFTDVANQLKKQTYIDKCIIRHVHPDWIRTMDSAKNAYMQLGLGNQPIVDQTFVANLAHEPADKINYFTRKKLGWPTQ